MVCDPLLRGRGGRWKRDGECQERGEDCEDGREIKEVVANEFLAGQELLLAAGSLISANGPDASLQIGASTGKRFAHLIESLSCQFHNLRLLDLGEK